MSPSPPWCDRRRLSLALIAIISNASYTTIAPILPLEINKHGISERWVSLIFLAFSIGSAVAPPLVARRLESVGTVRVIAYSMVGMSLLFWCLGHALNTVPLSYSDVGPSNHSVVILLTLIQFFMGTFFSAITTGYYSLATLVNVGKESAISSIEAAVGTGYILGPIFGSILYEEFGYQYAYAFISITMMAMAGITWKLLSLYLKYKPTEAVGDNIISDLEAQNGFANYNSCEDGLVKGRENIEPQSSNNNMQQKIRVQQPSTLSVLMIPKIFISATTIMWINVSWTFIEPLLAKRMDKFHLGKKEIGIVFSLSNIVYIPTIFIVQYLPRHYKLRHRTISLSTMLTPIAVLLVGSNTFSVVVLGIILLGVLPTPVWIMLLPFMQDESTTVVLDPNLKRCVNDVTVGIYNSFMTLGQVVGYIIGPLIGSNRIAVTTQIVALLIFLQSMLFYFGTGGHNLKRNRGVII